MSPTLFRSKGYRFYFLSNEESRIHIHISGEKGEAKYWLQPSIELAVNYGIPQKDLNQIKAIIEESQNEIIEAWRHHFGQR